MAARTKTSKDRPSYRCTECGWQTAKWLGRCPECQAWGTVEEYGAAPAVRTAATSPRPSVAHGLSSAAAT
ncbi:hypothetical protein AB0K70_28460, partial [Streptomyces werraensis]